MLKIICPHCGCIHKGKDLKQVSFYTTTKEIKYKAFAVVCMHCEKQFQTETTAQKTLSNKKKAIANWISTHPKKVKNEGLAERMGKPAEQIREEAKRITDESAAALVRGIIRQAVLDYKKSRHRRNVEDFFNSEWGAEVMEMFSTILSSKTHTEQTITPEMVLAQLKNNGVNFGALIMDEAEQNEVCNHL